LNNPNHNPALELVNLSKSYGDTVALAGLTLEVHRGEIFGLIGPDGAGKTTAMRIACGLLLPDQGSASVVGFDPRRSPRQVRERIGYMPQRFSLYPDLTVAENIRFFADLYGVSRDQFPRLEQRLMQFSRLGDFRNRRAGMLSGGMKQKLALSCTLIHTPELLILDEPTTGVDPVSRREFWRLLRELAGGGMALLISTPYMDEAGLCDRIALMHRGRILAGGTPAQVVGLFTQRLLEVTGPAIRDVRSRFEQLELSIPIVRFGNALHLTCATLGQEAEAIRALAGLDVQSRPISPTIEDLFMAMMEPESDQVIK